MKIVHAAENIKGGVGTYIRDLLVEQRDSFGADVVVALVPESQRGMVGTPAGVEIVTFDDSSASRFVNACRLAWRMREVVARVRPRIVHLHSTFAGAVLRPLLRLIASSTTVIYCPHGWAFDRDSSLWSRNAAKLIERMLARLCDAVVCISEYELRAARNIGIPASRLRLVPNGIPRDAPRPTEKVTWPDDRRRVLFVGRFDRQKGTDVLLAALAELQDFAFCYLVGDAVLGDTSHASLPSNAQATGWLSPSQIEAFYRSADVIVVPSRWEGFGLIAVEAMRAELPVIASRVGGLPEVVVDGETGVLVPPADKDALVHALRDISDEKLAAMGRSGRQRFLRLFTINRVHRQITAVYESARQQAVVTEASTS
ncbi:MAG TPA: glycosyltransferase family 4 protein [Steroidobacteraceae bacterium]|nr:glycosyltransferase family 4 protein [Steroidobacteraceae bacterium]